MKKQKSKLPPLHKLIDDMTSEEYHSVRGTWSSSQFKDLLDDEEIFINKYIKKTIPKEHIAAFDVGTYFHTGTLEPHKLTIDLAVYPGKVRHGEKWEMFKKKHAGKTIVTQSMVTQAEALVTCVQNEPLAMEYVKNGKPEISVFIELLVYRGEIYAPIYEKKYTQQFGWVDLTERMPSKALKNGIRFIVKTRADCISENFCMDLKSTTGNARSEDTMREKIKYYNYDLSAAMYLDMFSLEYGAQLAEFNVNLDYGIEVSKFAWVFASKDCSNARVHLATADCIRVGRAKLIKALLRLAGCIRNNFEVVSSIGLIGPHPSDLHLLQRDEDLL